MSPVFSRGQSGRVYRYYVSASLQQGAVSSNDDIVRRLPAPAFEKMVDEAMQRLLPREANHLALVLAVRICSGGLTIDLPAKHSVDLASNLAPNERIIHSSAKLCRIHLPIALPMRGGRRLIIPGSKPVSQPDQVLISALRKAHRLVNRDRKGLPIVEASPPSPYLRNLLQLAFLAPDIQHDIMTGHQPPVLNLQKLMKMDIPISWKEQREVLNWQDTQ